ncbi:MAG: putative manganese transporter [Bacteroidetes bacterium]|nr:putative manganese transporter [Bacteroidota bacterium]
MEAILDILKNSLSITFFVLAMMVVIEYVNVRTAGKFNAMLQKNGTMQIFMCALLGLLPGCLGAYTVVTFYAHNLVSFGALLAAFIAAMGDEAFILFSLNPRVGLLVAGILLALAIVSGLVCNTIVKKRKKPLPTIAHFEIHEHDCEIPNRWQSLKTNILHLSQLRIWLLVFLGGIIVLAAFNQIGHSHDFVDAFSLHDATCTHTEHHHEHGFNWSALTYIGLALILAYIVTVVPEHFLQEHLWGHTIKKHFLKIFVWTTILLLVVFVLNSHFSVSEFVETHKFYLLIMAILIGLIPESGPHIIFISLYLTGVIPIGILLANFIVQEGHAALPLFAESKKTFFLVKGVKCCIALVVGFLLM